MDFRQLEAFCAIIEWGSFSEAARRLYITQPTISNHMRMLETELNTSLINRTTKTMTVTPDGRRFYRYARNMLNTRDKAVSDFSRSGSHRIYIGASSAAAYILPAIMADYRGLHPDAYFEIIQSDIIGILENLQSEKTDAALTAAPCQEDGIECIPVFRDELLLATPDNERCRALREQARQPRPTGAGAAADDSYDVTELLLEPFIIPGNGSAERREVLNYLGSTGMPESQLNIAAQMDDMTTVINSVMHGLGVSVLPHSLISALPENSIITYPLTDAGGDPVYMTHYLLYRKNTTGGYIKDFADYIIGLAEKSENLQGTKG